MNKFTKIVLPLTLACLLVSCQKTGGEGEDNNSGHHGSIKDASLWGAPATEKILQDVHGIYDDIKTEAEINITAARGEYESQHIIITSKDKKINYTLEVNDLTASDGTVFSKEKIDVFHELYLEVSNDFDRTGNPLGKYPDALVPYDAIVNAKENFVEPNSNQGLYFRFNIPTDQKPGTYNGTAKIIIGGGSQEIPITLNIANLTVSEVNHTKSHFLTRWSQYRGELDTSQAMLDKYNQTLYEYRLCPSNLINDTNHTPAEIKEYVDLAYEHMQNPKCSSVAVPAAMDSSGVGFDANSLKQYLRAFAKKSFETGYNMMEKLIFNNNYVDEPQYWGPGGLPATITITNRYKEVISSLANALELDNTIQSPIKRQVIKSLKKIPHVITAWYEDDYAPYVDTWCPTYDYYDAEYSRANYDNQEEKWWYGCIDPKAPYPTYHIEDTLLSARLEPWMRAEYDVVGTLYWAVSVYAEYNGSSYQDIEDYYTGSASRFPRVNGDGWLLYPGARYGIEGPIPSLRIEAIRDGQEEYELLYALKNTYLNTAKSLGNENLISIDKIFSLLRNSLYNGTRVTAKNDTFYEARKALFEIARLNQVTGTCIADFYDDSYGNYVFTVLASNGVVLKQDGINTLTPTESASGYDKYVINVALANEKNYFRLSATKDGETCEYTQFLGGMVKVTTAENIALSNFGKETVTPEVALIDASSVDVSLTGKMIKIDVPQSNMSKEQAFQMKGDLVKDINEKITKATFHIYYNGEDNVKYVMSAKYQKNPIYFDLATVNLKKGLNTIDLNFSEKDWSTSGYIDYFAVYLGEGNGQPARTIYLVDTVLSGK